jgi:hypothetical protein
MVPTEKIASRRRPKAQQLAAKVNTTLCVNGAYPGELIKCRASATDAEAWR